MILALVLIPTLAGLLAFGLPTPVMRRGLLVGTALLHAVLTALCWKTMPASTLNGWLGLDAAG